MKITYLFGAGASAQALPIVSEIPASLLSLAAYLSEKRRDTALDSREADLLLQLINDVKWLHEENSRHASIDTFAKKLFIRGKMDDLRRLKIVMGFLFGHRQTLNRVDSRYDSFFASIIQDSKLNLPKNIKIISWNYDHQFELAFSEFSDVTNIYANQDKLNVVARNYKDSKIGEHFCIFKINGTASFWRPNQASTSLIDLLGENIIPAKNIVRQYELLRFDDKVIPSISFAWEKDADAFIHRVVTAVSETEVLIIIGYSFPFFNRETDRELINNMRSLHKVYFQSLEAGVIRERFLAIREGIPEKSLLIRNDVNQFLIPNEFDF